MSDLNSAPQLHTKQTLSQTENETLQPKAHRRRPESELGEQRRPLEDESKYFDNLMCALVSTRSEHDEHADTIRAALNNPEFDINRLRVWGGLPFAEAALLHVACSFVTQSHVGAQLLLSNERCDVNLQDSDGDTALMKAVEEVETEDDKHAKIIRLLLAHPIIDVNKQNKDGKTALHTACARKTQVAVQLLLSDGRCDVNVRNIEDDTPLMLAARSLNGTEDLATFTHLLLKYDALYVNHLQLQRLSPVASPETCTHPARDHIIQ